MRDILFRGKWDDGAWVIGSLVEMTGVINKGRTYIMPQGEGLSFEHFGERGTCSIGSFVEVDPATVGEYTGLKDKTGKRIFEGDILAFNPGDGEETSLYLVKWDNAQWKVCMGGRYPDDDMTNWNSEEWTVVGNIYDNSELIGGAA